MKPRVCMLAHSGYLSDGRVRRYAESLADRGAQVDILCVRDAKKGSADYRDDIRIYTIPLGHDSNSLVGYLVEYLLAVILYSLWLGVLHCRNRYHLVHIHNMPDFLMFCGIFPRLLGAKLVLDVHDPMPEFYSSKYDCSPDSLPIRLMRLQERASACLGTAVIAANGNFKDNIVARGTPEEKVIVVNNIADTSIFNRADHPRSVGIDAPAQGRRFTLLFPGTLAERYGLHVPIEAAVTLREKIPELLVRIVGPTNEYSEELANLAQELGVAEHVEILPAVPVDQVPAMMADADVGIYPARVDPHMNIATPTKVLEFMQMGLPVIASRLLVLEQMFGDDAIRYCEPGSVEEFAAAVEELWSDPQRRRSLVEKADLGFIHKRTWRDEREKYFALVDRILGTSLADAKRPVEDSQRPPVQTPDTHEVNA